MSRVTNIYKSFTYNMTAKTSRRRYETKLRHCHPVRYNTRRGVDNYVGRQFYASLLLTPDTIRSGVRANDDGGATAVVRKTRGGRPCSPASRNTGLVT